MNQKLIVASIALGFTILSYINQLFSKLAQDNQMYLIVSLLGYLLYGFLNYAMSKYKNLATSNIIQYGSHIIIAIVFMISGKIYFDETYSFTEYIGILLGLISMILLIFSNNIKH